MDRSSPDILLALWMNGEVLHRARAHLKVPGWSLVWFHNQSVKSIILKNFKLLQNDPETGTIISQPPLISFKCDKNIGNFLVRSSFQTNDQPMNLRQHHLLYNLHLLQKDVNRRNRID